MILDMMPSHAGQSRLRAEARRFNVAACGRRIGKTTYGCKLCIEGAMKGKPVCWGAPTYKMLAQAWDEMLHMLQPIKDIITVNKGDRTIMFATGGRIDFWTLGLPDACRGRKYWLIVVDEAAMVPNLEHQWTRALRPTLADMQGSAWFLSTPKGHDYFHTLFVRGQADDTNWMSWQMPTSTNPFIPAEEIEAAKDDLPAAAFDQEFLAEFISEGINPFGIANIHRNALDTLHAGKVAAWGIDLAKSQDYTCAYALDMAGRPVAFERFQETWRVTAQRLIRMIGNKPALVDSTGAGDPIVEQMQEECPYVEPYGFTTRSRQQLMEGLAYALHHDDVQFIDGVTTLELESFRYEHMANGVRYACPPGLHDDTVMALGLAVRCLQTLGTPLMMDTRSDDPVSVAVLDYTDEDDPRFS